MVLFYRDVFCFNQKTIIENMEYISHDVKFFTESKKSFI